MGTPDTPAFVCPVLILIVFPVLVMMTMIAFITIKIGLVPLIEGLCAQILYFRFEIIDGLRSYLLRFFVERRNILKENPS